MHADADARLPEGHTCRGSFAVLLLSVLLLGVLLLSVLLVGVLLVGVLLVGVLLLTGTQAL